MARKPPQKSTSQLSAERTYRFNEALKRIDSGSIRKQAILATHMDPRTFNKLVPSLESKGTTFQKLDSKGHYRISTSDQGYAKWEVLWVTGETTIETLDYENSLVMSRYWNAVRASLSNVNTPDTIKAPSHVTNVFGVVIPLERNYTSIRKWHNDLRDKHQSQLFNEKVYVIEHAA